MLGEDLKVVVSEFDQILKFLGENGSFRSCQSSHLLFKPDLTP